MTNKLLQIFAMLGASAALVAGCQTTGSGQPADESGGAAVDEATEPSDDSPGAPSEGFSVVFVVTPKAVSIDGEQILELDRGWLRRESLEDEKTYRLSGVGERVDRATARSRQSPKPVLIEVDSGVKVDVIKGLVATMSDTNISSVTIRTADGGSATLPLNGEYIRGRGHSFRQTPIGVNTQEESSGATSDGNERQHEEDERSAGQSDQRDEPARPLVVDSVPAEDQDSPRVPGLGNVDTGGPTEFTHRKPTWMKRKVSQAPTHIWVSVKSGTMKLVAARHSSDLNLPRYNLSGRSTPYEWWKLYNALSYIRKTYPSVRTLVVSPSMDEPVDVLLSAFDVACKLPEDSYESREAYENARANMEQCKPLFPEHAVGSL